MKKFLLSILLVLALVTSSFATTYYAQSGTANMSAIEWDTISGGGGTDLVWANRLAGDVFEANAQTGIVVDQDPGVGGEKVVLNTATNGGGFVITTLAAGRNVTADIGVSGKTGTTDVLTVSGTNTFTLTILGNIYGGGTTNADGLVLSGSGTIVTIGAVGSPVTIVGGSTSACYGVNDSRTVTTATVYANITAGSNATAGGYIDSGATGTTAITGNVTGATGAGYSTNRASVATVTGNCTGSATASAGVGCKGTSAAGESITGNIINGAREVGASGSVTWTPAASNYIQTVGGTDVYASQAPSITKVLSDTSVVVSTTGVYTAGTASGGGGAWGF